MKRLNIFVKRKRKTTSIGHFKNNHFKNEKKIAQFCLWISSILWRPFSRENSLQSSAGKPYVKYRTYTWLKFTHRLYFSFVYWIVSNIMETRNSVLSKGYIDISRAYVSHLTCTRRRYVPTFISSSRVEIIFASRPTVTSTWYFSMYFSISIYCMGQTRKQYEYAQGINPKFCNQIVS